MFDRKSTPCPVCSSTIMVSRPLFRLDFRCPQCDAMLKISPLYTRVLGLLSCIIGYVFAWDIGTRGPRDCVGIPIEFFFLCLPMAFLIMWLAVRIAPFLVRPNLVSRRT